MWFVSCIACLFSEIFPFYTNKTLPSIQNSFFRLPVLELFGRGRKPFSNQLFSRTFVAVLQCLSDLVDIDRPS